MRPRYKLEDDPMCGLTTGGREQCFWDCTLFSSNTLSRAVLNFENGDLISNPECLLDCYQEVRTMENLCKIYSLSCFRTAAYTAYSMTSSRRVASAKILNLQQMDTPTLSVFLQLGRHQQIQYALRRSLLMEHVTVNEI